MGGAQLGAQQLLLVQGRADRASSAGSYRSHRAEDAVAVAETPHSVLRGDPLRERRLGGRDGRAAPQAVPLPRVLRRLFPAASSADAPGELCSWLCVSPAEFDELMVSPSVAASDG